MRPRPSRITEVFSLGVRVVVCLVVSAYRQAWDAGSCLRIGFDEEPDSRRGPHVLTYSASCDVPEETLLTVTGG